MVLCHSVSQVFEVTADHDLAADAGAQQRVDVDEHSLIGAGQQLDALTQGGQVGAHN